MSHGSTGGVSALKQSSPDLPGAIALSATLRDDKLKIERRYGYDVTLPLNEFKTTRGFRSLVEPVIVDDR